MATSTIAFGKARVARNKGVPVPPDSIIDGEGRVTTDPTQLVDDGVGALKAFGQHKGSGLAIFCELLGGALTGGQTIQPEHEIKGGILNSVLGVVIDTGRLGDKASLDHEVEAIRSWIKASKPAPGIDKVRVPGEPELEHRAERAKSGIPLDAKSLDDILAAAARAGVPTTTLDDVREGYGR